MSNKNGTERKYVVNPVLFRILCRLINFLLKETPSSRKTGMYMLKTYCIVSPPKSNEPSPSPCAASPDAAQPSGGITRAYYKFYIKSLIFLSRVIFGKQ